MTDGSNLVTIRDIDVPFWRIVLILVKWSIASIPALIILAILITTISTLVGGLVFSALDGLGFVQMPEVPTAPTP
jgi:hypothetical protein